MDSVHNFLGKRRLSYANGTFYNAQIVAVMNLSDGTPIWLRDDKGNIYPWNAISKIGPRRD